MRITRKFLLRKLRWLLLATFLTMNVVAYFHAYKFTHFSVEKIEKTKGANHLSSLDKAKTLLFGVNNPRPTNKGVPTVSFESVWLGTNGKTAGWWMPVDSSRGTVVLFHGYSGEKYSMLDKAYVFRKLGYSTFLVDFMGSGESYGNQTTIGFFEANQVQLAYQFLREKGEETIFLFGTSMGAVAVLKAVKDYDLDANGLILECPFGSMLETVQARFRSMQIPSFPMANLLVFWGGVQNGFNAFSHKPSLYAKNVSCPTLLMHGQLDEKVSSDEIRRIYNNLSGPKTLVVYPLAGHENYLNKYAERWTQDVGFFLSQN
ncbi:MAG: alpha/beta hydrolase [Flavobacteriales bacterium]|nr:alpha/beta hydrolase [Bacteroidota bacterium]MCB9241480.1 alpha/beta hydrolase [Flavobacteriales bacterium]